MIPELAKGQLWKHRNGTVYEILMIVNLPDDEHYPKTVVYETMSNGNRWARRYDDWHRSFTFISEQT